MGVTDAEENQAESDQLGSVDFAVVLLKYLGNWRKDYQ